jgi:tRNA pseudouridine38-40 synthase
LRYFIEISYKGTRYHGWQVQQNAHTVQEEIQRALGILLRQEISITGSGRTDTGVHALQQFAHFDASHGSDTRQLAYRLNSLLPPDIAISRVFTVRTDAHARFDATERAYIYRIHQQKNPFLQEQSYYFSQPLSLNNMNKAAGVLTKAGSTDFSCFSKAKSSQKTHICRISQAYWQADSDLAVSFHISADRFLRGMVRAMVGTLLEIGTGRRSVSSLKEVIDSRDRRRAGRSVPPEGLYLSRVLYPEDIFG